MNLPLLPLLLFASSCSALLKSPSLLRSGGDGYSFAGRPSPSLASSTTKISPTASRVVTFDTDTSQRQGLRFLTPKVCVVTELCDAETRALVSHHLGNDVQFITPNIDVIPLT